MFGGFCYYQRIAKPEFGSGPFCLSLHVLTHWGQDKVAVIFQTTFSNEFSWMKMYQFRLRFHWSLLPRVKSTRFHPWFRYWLGADQAISLYLKQEWKVYRRIYVSHGLNELKLLSVKETPNQHSINYRFNFLIPAKLISLSINLRYKTGYQYDIHSSFSKWYGLYDSCI